MTTINTQEDFLRALAENPQWREAVRALILGEEMMRLPVKFDTFVENEFYPFVKRVDQFIGEQIQFNERVDRFIGEQIQFNERVDHFIGEQLQFNARVDHFIGEQLQFNAEQRQINAEQRQINARTDYNIKRLTDDVGHLKGWATRNKVRDEAPVIAHELGLRFVRIVPIAEMLDLARIAAQGAAFSGELRSFYKADLVIEATDGDGAPCYLLVEVSFTANRRDANRARRNAALMTQITGIPARAVVGGVHLHESIRELVDSGEIHWFEVEGIPQEED